MCKKVLKILQLYESFMCHTVWDENITVVDEKFIESLIKITTSFS